MMLNTFCRRLRPLNPINPAPDTRFIRWLPQCQTRMHDLAFHRSPCGVPKELQTESVSRSHLLLVQFLVIAGPLLSILVTPFIQQPLLDSQQGASRSVSAIRFHRRLRNSARKSSTASSAGTASVSAPVGNGCTGFMNVVAPQAVSVNWSAIRSRQFSGHPDPETGRDTVHSFPIASR